MRGKVEIKEWLFDRISAEAKSSDVWLTCVRDDKDMIDRSNGKVTVFFDELHGESAKALHVRLASGDVCGSYRGWTVWLPKSQAEIVEVLA